MSAPSTGWTINTVAYGNAGNQPLLADIYTASTPPNDGAPKPLYLFFHGGCLIFGDRKTFPPVYLIKELVVSRGWTFVSFDYRLLPEATLEDINDDLLAVEQFVLHKLSGELAKLQLPTADLTKVVVSGASAGGYCALQGGHLWKELKPRAVVAAYPMTFTRLDWYAQPHPEARPQAAFLPAVIDEAAVEQLLTNKGARISAYPLGDWKQPRFALYRLLINRGQYWRLLFGSDAAPAELPPAKQRLLPALNVTASYPPTLLVHGAADTTVPVGESDDVAKTLAAAGVEHDYVRVEGREHGLDALPVGDDVAAARQAIVDFALRHM